MAQLFGAIHELTGGLTQGTCDTVSWVNKNRDRRAAAFRGGVAGNEGLAQLEKIKRTYEFALGD